jgi:ubiquinone/menaquinone biosynthesis C-methylase UbiE
MIQGAKAASPTVTDGTTLDFVQSAAEELGFLKDGSVDLVIAGGRLALCQSNAK